MRIKFKATSQAPEYDIHGETINGIDLSNLDDGDKFITDEETREAGIRDAFRQDGELFVTLKQVGGSTRKENNWEESDWIDVKDYNLNKCYIKALHKTEDDEIVWGVDIFGIKSWIVTRSD